MNDTEARFKLRRSLLTIHDTFPQGFTHKELADHAMVGAETARDYAKPGNKYLEIVGKTEGALGRPGNVYVVSDRGMKLLLDELSRTEPDIVWKTLSKPIDDLALMISGLSDCTGDALTRRTQLVEIDLKGCENHLRHLEAEWPDMAARFEAALERQRVVLKLRTEAENRSSPDLEDLLSGTTTIPRARSILVPLLGALSEQTASRILAVLGGKVMLLLASGTAPELRQWLELIREVSAVVAKTYPGYEPIYFQMRTVLSGHPLLSEASDFTPAEQPLVTKEDGESAAGTSPLPKQGGKEFVSQGANISKANADIGKRRMRAKFDKSGKPSLPQPARSPSRARVPAYQPLLSKAEYVHEYRI